MENFSLETETPQPTGRLGLTTPSCSLLKWLDDNAAQLTVESWAIADTGDYDHHWAVYESLPPKGLDKRTALGIGSTPALAIEDAMKDDDDPTKYSYIPPEFR